MSFRRNGLGVSYQHTTHLLKRIETHERKCGWRTHEKLEKLCLPIGYTHKLFIISKRVVTEISNTSPKLKAGMLRVVVWCWVVPGGKPINYTSHSQRMSDAPKCCPYLFGRNDLAFRTRSDHCSNDLLYI